MTAGTVAVVLLAAIGHAVWNTAAKFKRGDAALFVALYTGTSALLCLPVGLIPVVAGTESIDRRLAIGCLVSAVLHVVYTLTLQTGYERADLGVVYPVARGSGPVLTMIIAVVLLGERPGGVALMGAVAVVVGVAIVTGNPLRAGAGRSELPGVAWGGATGVAIAAYTLWDSYAVTSLGLMPVTYFAGTLLLQSLMFLPLVIRRRRSVLPAYRTNARQLLAVAVLSPASYLLVLTALQSAPVALVAPLRESSIVVASFLAWWLFNEGHPARRIRGAVVVLCGIAAISL